MNKSKYRYLLAGAFALSAIASIAKHTLGHIELTPDVGIAISKEYGRVVLVSDEVAPENGANSEMKD